LQFRAVNTFLASVRAVYSLATIILFGELVFRWWVERVALRRLPKVAEEAWLASRPRSAILAAALAAAFLSSVLWFLAQAQVMSGVPFEALSRDTLHGALFDSGFGRDSLVRFGLALAFAIALALLRKEKRSNAMTMAAGVIALGLLSSIAWTGHANGEQGQSRIVHLSADVMHLLAAGAWLGALPALALILFHIRRDTSALALELAALVTGRFSILGIAAVSTLTLTGIVNACYTMGSLPALLGTDYGRLLSLKVLLFGAMLALAAMNRFRYTPQVLQSASCARKASCHGALARLGVNAMGEIALGIAVVCIVGALGTATPAAHVQTVWPFRFTLSLEAVRESSLGAAACVAALAASVILASTVLRHRPLAVACAAGIAMVALSILLSLLAVPAYPTTYFHSPIRYSAESIASGARLYAGQCSLCHGPQGHEHRHVAGAFAERPVDLTGHVLHQREGDVLWRIKRGIPGTPMPAFDGRMRESDIWNMINWLRAQAEAEEAKRMGSAVQTWAIEAPDFTFQIDHEMQESLADQRGHSNVLLVLFDPTESQARVRMLAKSQRELQQAGLRVIAIPTRAEGASAAGSQEIGAPIVAGFDRRITSAYGIVAPMGSIQDDRPGPKHAEFLIDRQGYIRARWTPDNGSVWLQVPYLLGQLAAMDRNKPQSTVSHDDDHAH
jgi:putative copper export protein/mono/diheme cytochrome c family protein/peroxiredoxin